MWCICRHAGMDVDEFNVYYILISCISYQRKVKLFFLGNSNVDVVKQLIALIYKLIPGLNLFLYVPASYCTTNENEYLQNSNWQFNAACHYYNNCISVCAVYCISLTAAISDYLPQYLNALDIFPNLKIKYFFERDWS